MIPTILHVQDDELPSCFVLSEIYFIMPKSKKKADSLEILPNYSKYEYADKLPSFNEFDHVLKMELSTLECYKDYELEASLNHFCDQILNDYSYMIFQKKQLETPTLIRGLVSFFSSLQRPLTT